MDFGICRESVWNPVAPPRDSPDVTYCFPIRSPFAQFENLERLSLLGKKASYFRFPRMEAFPWLLPLAAIHQEFRKNLYASELVEATVAGTKGAAKHGRQPRPREARVGVGGRCLLERSSSSGDSPPATAPLLRLGTQAGLWSPLWTWEGSMLNIPRPTGTSPYPLTTPRQVPLFSAELMPKAARVFEVRRCSQPSPAVTVPR